MDSLRLSSLDAIRRAGFELLTANPGASLAEVAERAGVGRATLHRHFPARTDLLRSLAIEALDATDAACAHLDQAPTGAAALAWMFEALVPLGAPYAFLARYDTDDPEVVGRYQAQVASLGGLVEALRSEGHVRPDVPEAWATAVISDAIWTAWSLVAKGEIAPRVAAKLATDTVLHGLGGNR